jgi:hypothetical protein
MNPQPLRQCDCPTCRRPEPSPTKEHHARINAFLGTLTEEQRRLFAGLEASRLGHGGVGQLALVTGLGIAAVFRGQRELDELQTAECPPVFDAVAYKAKLARQVEDLPPQGQRKVRLPLRQFKSGAD